MISLPIWLLVLLCVFGFIGVITVILVIYAIFSSIFIPVYIDKEDD